MRHSAEEDTGWWLCALGEVWAGPSGLRDSNLKWKLTVEETPPDVDTVSYYPGNIYLSWELLNIVK